MYNYVIKQSIYTIDGTGEDESPLITVKSPSRKVSHVLYQPFYLYIYDIFYFY